jgi:putative transposase
MHKHLPTRWDVDEAWYFVSVVTRDRYPYFKSSEACQLLLDGCKEVRKRHPYRLGALVIMPDHWHALLKPQGKEVIESVVGIIKQYVFHASRKSVGSIVLWQPRFMDHRIRDEADYNYHLEYMRTNPHKHELVDAEKAEWCWWFVHKHPFGDR